MAGRIPLLALMLCAANLSAQDAVPLAGYSFDDTQTETGPDTFRVFDKARGKVSLSSAIRYSGYYSVQIQDAAGDRDFPELQGYFPLRQTGVLSFHFAFLTADPTQSLNIALAGPQGFGLKRNGIGFWLSVREGRLLHTSDSIPKPLLRLEPFAWYVVDLRYDIAHGRYDLRISDNGAAVVDLKDAANAANQPGSAVDTFSFVGDVLEDASNVVYFVDDIWVSADSGPVPAALVAPGRRKLFIDRWADNQRRLRAQAGCVGIVGAEDFGLSQAAIRARFGDGAWKAFAHILSGQDSGGPLPADIEAWRDGIAQWREGCRQLQAGQAGLALQQFDAASQRLPAAPLLALSKAQALAALRRWDAVDRALAQAGPDFAADPRYGVAAGQIAFARRGGLRQEEQIFFSLLWQQRHSEAMEYARDRAGRFPSQPAAQAVWTERVGDAAFLAGWREDAAQAYKASLALDANRTGPLAKLSDLAYLAGEVEQERHYREAVYGSLRD